MYFLRRISLFTVLTLAVVSPRFVFATDAVVPSRAYVDDTFDEKANKVSSIASNEESNTTKYTSNAAVTGFAQKKPSSVANGKVLTYTGNDANSSVTAGYIKLPVASGAPSSNTPSSFVEVWVQ